SPVLPPLSLLSSLLFSPCSLLVSSFAAHLPSLPAIPNATHATFLLILRFIYTGDVAFVTEQNAIDVLEAANYFKCDRLKAQCEDVLRKSAEKPEAKNEQGKQR